MILYTSVFFSIWTKGAWIWGLMDLWKWLRWDEQSAVSLWWITWRSFLWCKPGACTPIAMMIAAYIIWFLIMWCLSVYVIIIHKKQCVICVDKYIYVCVCLWMYICICIYIYYSQNYISWCMHLTSHLTFFHEHDFLHKSAGAAPDCASWSWRSLLSPEWRPIRYSPRCGLRHPATQGGRRPEVSCWKRTLEFAASCADMVQTEVISSQKQGMNLHQSHGPSSTKMGVWGRKMEHSC